jgi:hypothetical protein
MKTAGGFAMPLTLRDTWAEDERVGVYKDVPDYCVMSGEFVVGRIMKDRTGLQTDRAWEWAINGVHAGPDVMKKRGYGPTLAEAKAQFRENWNKWLDWAALQEREYLAPTGESD